MGMLIASDLQAVSLPRDKTTHNPSTRFYFLYPPISPAANDLRKEETDVKAEVKKTSQNSDTRSRINLRMS